MTPARRQVFAALADIIAPGDLTMPPADALDLAGAPLDAVLRRRPDLAAPLERLLDGVAPADRSGAVARLAGADPAAFSVLMQAVLGAYYADARVRHLLGDPLPLPRAPAPIEPEALALTRRLSGSPPRFRDAPAATTVAATTGRKMP